MKLRKILAMLLVVCMVFGTMGTAVFAEETADYSDVIASVEAVELNGTGHTFAVQFNGKGQPVNSYLTANNSSPWIMNVFINSNQNLKLEYGNPDADGYVSVLVPSMEILTGGWFNLPSPYPMSSMEFGKPINTTANTPCGVLGYFWECLGSGNKVSQHYEDIFAGEQGLSCGVSLTPKFIADNDNFYAEISLVIYQLEGGEEKNHITLASYSFGEKPVAKIGDVKYATLQAAIDAAVDGDVVTVLTDIELSDTLTIPSGKVVILDLSGHTMTYDSTTQGEAMITNKGELTINDSVGTGVINYNYTGAADSTYGKGNYTISNAGTLTVNGGKITIAKLSGHAKYPIDNNSTTGDAILVINGGHLYNYNTSAIRQFCNSETNKNSVTINGGVVEGYCAIWVQNPGSKTVNGSLAITGGEIKTTAKAWVNGTSELKDVSSAIYCTIADANGAWSEDSSVAITGGTINENVSLATEAPDTITVDKSICNGYVELVEIAPTGSNSPAYTKEVDGYVRVWGEGGGNAKESFVLKLYSGETLMATTQMNNVGGIIDGDVYVTWNFFYPESNDEYWTTIWEEGHPNADEKPTKVELYIDGTLVATTDAQMNGADGINPVVWSELGGVAPTAPVYVAQIGDDKYTSLEEAIAAAVDGDVVEILPGEYDPINISNKNITIKGTVGDNGELLTTIKGGNPAITGHSFNGTIKDIKIVDAFKVMYAEPAGNVTVDNVYVTGATYGLHLIAYSKGLTWTLQNSYMDLSWANSFGVYGDGDAAIIIKGNRFETKNPYYPDYGAIHVNSFLPNVTVEENIFGENAKIYIDDSVTDTSNINISKNYHADGVDKAFAVDEDGGKTVDIYQYYAELNEDGTIDKNSLVTITPAVAKIGDVEYATLQAAIDAAVSGDIIVIVADIADEDTIVNKALTITADENNKPVLNNVSISAEGEAAVASLTVSNLKFTGDSWINSGVANELTVSNVEADVTPSNTSKTNSRSAFISLGSSEHKELALTVENCNIVSRGGSDPVLGWAAITEANITGNTFGSADSYQTYSDSVKFMGIADGAVINVTDNTVYSNYNGIVFGQNTTRNNAYTANISGNTFYGGADHIWIEVSGSNTVNATINAASNNTINGNAFTASDIKVHPNINTWTSYAGIDVITDADGKVIGGVLSDFAEDKIAQGYAAIKNLNGNYIVGTKPTAEVNNLGMQTVPAGNYMVYGGGSTAEDMPLSFVMQFVADQSEEDMATSPYAEWYGDFVITFTGIEDGSFIADGCYLAGHYGSFGWVKVPVDGMKIEEGERYPVMLGVGMGQKYDYICSSVQDFKCALYLAEDILKTNPNIQVNLELAVVDNSKGEDAAASALVNNENTYKVVDYTYDADDFVVANYVAQVGETKYTTLAEAIAAAVEGDTVTVLTDIELSDTLTIPSGKVVTLDLNGKTISGVCNASQGHLIMVSYGADLTIKDSSTEQTGKITYAQGTSNVGWTIDVEGDLVLESGTIELTGSWSIGYAVDVRPNAWGSAYTVPTTFVMNGGNIVSSDAAVRVASSSSDTYPDVAASFTMNDGKIDAAWDGVFVQQSNAAWDKLSFTMNGGTIESDLNPVRLYGPAPSSYVNGAECVDIKLNGGTLEYTGTEAREWLVDGILRIGGGATADEFLKDATVTASATFAQDNAADGYTWVGSDGVYTLEKVKTKLFEFAGQTASLDSSLALNIYLASSNVMGEGYYAIVEHEKEDGTIRETKIPDTDWVESGAYKAIRYTGVAAKEMADKLTITVYNANDTQVSVSQDTSLRTYALNTLNRIVSKNITDQWSWLPALTDMLNYGAAAQDMFKYNQDDYAYVGAEDFQEHASSSDIYTLDKEGCSSSGLASGATVTFEEMLKLNFYFKDVTNDMYATYSYTTHRGTKVEGRVNYDSFTTYTYNNVVYLGAPVPVAIADANALVTVTLFNGKDEVMGTATYKVNAYLKTHINKPDAIYDALAKFAVSAKTAFANE